MKRVLVILLILVSGYAKAQFPDHIAMMTDTWEMINLMDNIRNAKGEWVPYFPPSLTKLNNKVIELPGYMMPYRGGLVHKEFMISVLPVMQCQFCGQGDVPPLVEVHLTKGVPYDKKPIIIRGTLILNDKDRNRSAMIISNATVKQK